MSDTAIATARRCLNCAAELTGRFCAQCGQQEQELAIPFRQFMREFFSTVFALDSRLLQSFRQLILRPGYLTVEHYAGRRVRYESPLRLYLLSSVVFLLLASMATADSFQLELPDSASAAVEQPTDATVTSRTANGTAGAVQALRARWQLGKQRALDNPDLMRQHYFRAFSWTMFLLMPAFALLLGLFFRRAGRLYLHHVVFALHYHAFAFLALSALIVGMALTHTPVLGPLTFASIGWLLLYLVLSLRAVYRQSWGSIVLKTVGLLLVYGFLVEAFSFLTMIAVILAA